MKGELYGGRLIRADDKTLVFAAKEIGEDESSFPYEGFTIDKAWLNTYLGTWLNCKIVDGVITEFET